MAATSMEHQSPGALHFVEIYAKGGQAGELALILELAFPNRFVPHRRTDLDIYR